MTLFYICISAKLQAYIVVIESNLSPGLDRGAGSTGPFEALSRLPDSELASRGFDHELAYLQFLQRGPPSDRRRGVVRLILFGVKLKTEYDP